MADVSEARETLRKYKTENLVSVKSTLSLFISHLSRNMQPKVLHKARLKQCRQTEKVKTEIDNNEWKFAGLKCTTMKYLENK